ncbi:MAG: redox-regulated ATPase YchF [Flavobacteriales bacterium]|nr:redox-regulated ATPase YchF [Flavobacteriales bacterium]|tara:strand:- start:12 stop:1103 length:1092 start_codon:yes stop_codon:yes gene_type:complete
MKCGIVGLPNVGKSTLFNCLSNAKALAANYPFATIEPNIGVIPVPDDRLAKLEELVKPQRVQQAIVEIVDIAGLVRGASKGEGLGNKFLANIRETQAIIHVLRCFNNDNITHVDGSIDPVRDKETIDLELQIKDLESIEKKIESTKKKIRIGDKQALKDLVLLEKYKIHFESGNSARSIDLSDKEKDIVSDLMLLTDKPILYICNVGELDAVKGNSYVQAVRESIKGEDSEILIIAAGMEADIMELDSFEERQEFLQDMGLNEPGVKKVIRTAYRLLNLQTYFTAGEKEVRAWTIKEGFTAAQAAGVIHSDFEKGFIRAEVIGYSDFISLGSDLACKEAGKLSVEGKDYVVKDGDVMHFRFNV